MKRLVVVVGLFTAACLLATSACNWTDWSMNAADKKIGEEEVINQPARHMMTLSDSALASKAPQRFTVRLLHDSAPYEAELALTAQDTVNPGWFMKSGSVWHQVMNELVIDVDSTADASSRAELIVAALGGHRVDPGDSFVTTSKWRWAIRLVPATLPYQLPPSYPLADRVMGYAQRPDVLTSVHIVTAIVIPYTFPALKR